MPPQPRHLANQLFLLHLFKQSQLRRNTSRAAAPFTASHHQPNGATRPDRRRLCRGPDTTALGGRSVDPTEETYAWIAELLLAFANLQIGEKRTAEAAAKAGPSTTQAANMKAAKPVLRKSWIAGTEPVAKRQVPSHQNRFHPYTQRGGHSGTFLTLCRGPVEAATSGQVEVPNSQLISCLDSSLGRVAACGAGGRRFAPRVAACGAGGRRFAPCP